MGVSLRKTHFHVVHAMPGYLPESEPVIAFDAEWAMQLWNSEVTYALDAIYDDSEYLRIDCARNARDVSDLVIDGYVEIVVGGYVYSVDAIPSTVAECGCESVPF